MHEGGGRWVGSNKLVELKKKKKLINTYIPIGGSDGKASAYNVGDPASIPGLGRSPGE